MEVEFTIAICKRRQYSSTLYCYEKASWRAYVYQSTLYIHHIVN